VRVWIRHALWHWWCNILKLNSNNLDPFDGTSKESKLGKQIAR